MDDIKVIEPCSFSHEERELVKAAILELIEECRRGGTVCEDASARLEAVAHGAEALMLL